MPSVATMTPPRHMDLVTRYTHEVHTATGQPCRSPAADPDSWYPEELDERGPEPRWLRQYAQALCDGCPVQAQCLMLALLTGETSGIWGGATPEQRRDLRSRYLSRGGAQ